MAVGPLVKGVDTHIKDAVIWLIVRFQYLLFFCLIFHSLKDGVTCICVWFCRRLRMRCECMRPCASLSLSLALSLSRSLALPLSFALSLGSGLSMMFARVNQKKWNQNHCKTLNTFWSYDIILSIHLKYSVKARVGRCSVVCRLANVHFISLWNDDLMKVSLPVVQSAKIGEKRSIQVYQKIYAEIRLIRVWRKSSLWKKRMFWRPNKAKKSCRIH